MTIDPFPSTECPREFYCFIDTFLIGHPVFVCMFGFDDLDLKLHPTVYPVKVPFNCEYHVFIDLLSSPVQTSSCLVISSKGLFLLKENLISC